ncbi:MAG TPA: SpoIVB peptidase S55 domain-containing protein [Opitutaceae bacterium]
MRRVLLLAALSGVAVSLLADEQPENAPLYPLSDLHAGQDGTVWTVFQGTKPEPFHVTVAGVVLNALGPGKSLILCRMTDPRVQKMGAVAGMSGSPLYIDGKFAGALSYQITSFETEHFAGFTPAADMAEVGSLADTAPVNAGFDSATPSREAESTPLTGGCVPLRPAFTLSGLSPTVAALLQPEFRAVGLDSVAVGGSGDTTDQPAGNSTRLQPGDAVSAALATGDVTLAGTGTVSTVSGNRIVAFGHPMMSLGNVQLPMCTADIVTIIPSQLESIKVANTGRIIGTVTQDRLSAISGLIGQAPPLIDVTVQVKGTKPRQLHFRVARQQQLSPVIIAAGLSQAILGSNDAGLNNGFRIASSIDFAPAQNLSTHALYAGPQAFALGVSDFVKGLSQDLQNPYEKTFPRSVTFTVEPLSENPDVTIDSFQLSESTATAGDSVAATIGWRDYQGDEHSEEVRIPISPDWVSRNIEVVLASGAALDELAGHPRQVAPAQLRSFDAYLDAMRQDRPTDGLFIAVVESGAVFSDQTATTVELPSSFARVAASADEARFSSHPALLPLWQKHILAGKLTNVMVRRPLKVTE